MWFKRKNCRVKLTGRAGLLYEEGNRSMLVDSEMLAGKDFDMVIYSESIKQWQPPHETEPISDADRDRIRNNISRELSGSRIDWQ